MKFIITISLILAALSQVPAAEKLITTVAILGENPSPGELSTLCISTTELPKLIRAEVRFGNNLAKTIKGFVVDKEAKISIVQLPFGSLWSIGKYSIKLTVVFDQNRREEQNLSLELHDKKFNQEIIPLNSSNTAIKTEPNKTKDEQIERMANLLSLFDPEALPMTLAFDKPLTDIRLTSDYGDRRIYQYSNGKKEVDDHRGLDYGAPEGSPVKSGVEGRVVLVENRVTTGNTVIVQVGPGAYVLYFHMQKSFVNLGDLVHKQTEIGLVGKTGLATGPHLHFELQVQGVSINPTYFYSKAFIDIEAIKRVLSVNNL